LFHILPYIIPLVFLIKYFLKERKGREKISSFILCGEEIEYQINQIIHF